MALLKQQWGQTNTLMVHLSWNSQPPSFPLSFHNHLWCSVRGTPRDGERLPYQLTVISQVKEEGIKVREKTEEEMLDRAKLSKEGGCHEAVDSSRD